LSVHSNQQDIAIVVTLSSLPLCHEDKIAIIVSLPSLRNIIQDSEEASSIFQTHRARAFMIEGAALFGNDGVAKTLYLA
jgi:hypothetical protein